MQDLDPTKNFKIGNLCINDKDDIIKIIEDFEKITIPNSKVWGEISRVLNSAGKGGSIQGNLDGYACRFEIDGDSYNIGTIINPTSLKIFSKSKDKNHAIFDKSSGALVLGANRQGAYDTTSIIETYAGFRNLKGTTKFHDAVGFLASADRDQLIATLPKIPYTFRYRDSSFPSSGLVSIGPQEVYHDAPVNHQLKSFSFGQYDIIDVYVDGEYLRPKDSLFSVDRTNNIITFTPAFVKKNNNAYHIINVIQTVNDDQSLLNTGKTGAHFIGSSAYFYKGSSIIFSAMDFPSESLLLTDDPSKIISISPPENINIANDENGNPVNSVDLIFPGTQPEDGALLQYVDKDQNLQWVVGGVNKEALTDLGLKSMSNTQLITLVLAMRTALAELGKDVPMPVGTVDTSSSGGGSSGGSSGGSGSGGSGGSGGGEIVIGPF